MKCPKCGNSAQLEFIGAASNPNESAWSCPACARRYLVQITDMADVLSNMAGQNHAELAKMRDKLAAQLASIETQLRQAREDHETVLRFTRAQRPSE
jgi:hypothetical protein